MAAASCLHPPQQWCESQIVCEGRVPARKQVQAPIATHSGTMQGAGADYETQLEGRIRGYRPYGGATHERECFAARDQGEVRTAANGSPVDALSAAQRLGGRRLPTLRSALPHLCSAGHSVKCSFPRDANEYADTVIAG